MEQDDLIWEASVSPIDEATKAAIQKAIESVKRGEAISLEQSKINLENGYREWRRQQSKASSDQEGTTQSEN